MFHRSILDESPYMEIWKFNMEILKFLKICKPVLSTVLAVPDDQLSRKPRNE